MVEIIRISIRIYGFVGRILQYCEYIWKTDWIFKQLLQMHLWSRKFPLHFGSQQDPDLGTGVPDRTRPGEDLRSPCVFVSD